MNNPTFLIGLAMLGLTATMSAQNAEQLKVNETISQSSSDDDEKLIHKGVNTVDLYAGPSLIRSAYKNLAESGSDGLAFSGIPNIGLVYEHLLTDRFGLGAEIGYSSTKMSFTEVADYGNGPQSYSSSWKFSVYRIMVRCNFHWVRTKHFDMYGFISAGYRGGSNTFTTSDPGYTGKLTYSPIPVGVKPGLGFRYFFTKNIGVNLEVAIGTPVIGGGLSFAF